MIFSLELTHDVSLLLPLLLASMIAYLLSVLMLKRSILTEKVARRGFHVLCEYSIDPLEALFVRDVMATDVVTVTPDRSTAGLYAGLDEPALARRQRLLPVLQDGVLVGAVPWNDILELAASGAIDSGQTVADVMRTSLVIAYPDETLRTIADRMAEQSLSVLPVVERARPTTLLGIVTQFDLLAARTRNLVEEREREAVLRFWPLPRLRLHRATH